MRRFAFEAVDGSGVRRHGTGVALDEFDLDRQLGGRGLVLLNARPMRSKGKVTARTITDLFYHLSVVLGSGVPILQGLRDLQESGQHPLATELADMERKVEGGTSFSDALAAHPDHFPELAVALVRAGEQTGKLDAILHDLVGYLEWREDLRRKVRSATTYPVILLFATIGLCGILAFFVLPRFTGIFSELGVTIPAPMRAVLFMRKLVVVAWPGLLAAGGLLTAGVWIAQRSGRGRLVRDRLALRTPLFGRLILSLDLSRFCRNLSVLHAAGVPILDALALTTEIVQNRVVRQTVGRAIDRLQAGAGLMDSLHPEGVFPSMVLRMLHMGETTGRLEEALNHVARFYDREVPSVIDRVMAVFNVAVLLFMGGTVVMLGLSFFVPLYQMMGSLNAG